MFSALQNSPIVIDLVQQARTTGWSLLPDGITAAHDSCNSGGITNTAYPLLAGHSYKISWRVLSVSGGYVQLQTPGSNGAMQTAPNLYVETVNPTSNGFASFFSNATCQIQAFNVQDVTASGLAGTTIVYSAKNKKWSDMRTFYPDYGWALYTRTILANNGAIYTADNGGTSGNSNNFFGTQFQSTIKFVEAKNPDVIKDFEALNYQANMLLVTTIDGIQSSLGQISTLIDTDFIKQNLADGGLEVTIYQKDGVYSASFLNDENENIVNGSQLRGNYLILELITVDGSTPLTLFSIAVRSRYVPIGSR